ncbi:hypothetical protein KCP71_05320 [Salmonella enterica subsp. enterica]|nr:hypothetical protein KCP71_05320 [Salmonella enterica subsp. enterica]
MSELPLCLRTVSRSGITNLLQSANRSGSGESFAGRRRFNVTSVLAPGLVASCCPANKTAL